MDDDGVDDDGLNVGASGAADAAAGDPAEAPASADPERLKRLRANAHPLRLRMASLLTGAPMSASDLARELDITQANASYHVRRLAAAGLVDQVDEVTIRGGRAKRYRYVADRGGPQFRQRRPDDSPETRMVFEAAIGELRRRLTTRLATPDTQFTDAQLWVDPQVWADVVSRVAAAMLDLHDAAQPPHHPGTIETAATVVLFEMDESGPGGDDDGVGS